MKATANIVTNHTEYHHCNGPDLFGMPLRSALKTLREVEFGNIGGTHAIDLSDGTYLEVACQPAIGGGSEMGSQKIHRFEWTFSREKIIRKYNI